MASTNADNAGMRTIPYAGWGRGIITSKPSTEIPDDAAQDIINMEFDESDNLSTRNGFVELNANTYASRITSAYYFTSGSGEIGILFTTGSQLRIVETNGTGDTNLTGALTLPNDTFWQWITYKDIAIGVNKATSGDNPVKVSTGAVAAALGGSPPKGKYIALWENRVWIVSATEPNQLRGSHLGDPENWSTGTDAQGVSIDIEIDDNDIITGLFATKDALYIWKTKKIYKLGPINPATAITNASNLRVSIFSQTIGCVSPYSIAPLLDDVVYLSAQGLASLRLSEVAEDFRTALYSRNVAEIGKINKTTEEIPSLLLPNANQYWLSFPSNLSTRSINESYILDYLNIQAGVDAARWTRFTGLAGFTAATSFPSATGTVYVVGAENPDGTHQLFTYVPKEEGGVYSDNGESYPKELRTKAFPHESVLLRKEWHKWGFNFDLLTNTAQVAIQYFFDDNLSKGGNQSFNMSAATLGALWDQAIWDADSWDSAVQGPVQIIRRLLSNSSGRIGETITFRVSNGQADEAIVIKDMLLMYTLLNEKGVTDL